MSKSWDQWVEDGLLIFILSGMIGLSMMQILLRNIWGTSWTWVEPVIRLGVLWIGLLGAMIATRRWDHIQIDVLHHYVSDRVRHLMQRLCALVSALVCLIIALLSAQFVAMDAGYLLLWESGEGWMFEQSESNYLMANLPNWPFLLILPYAFAQMAWRFLQGVWLVQPAQGDQA